MKPLALILGFIVALAAAMQTPISGRIPTVSSDGISPQPWKAIKTLHVGMPVRDAIEIMKPVSLTGRDLIAAFSCAVTF